MIEARSHHTATLLPDGSVLVAGGYSSYSFGSDPLAEAELYDPSSGTWTATRNMAEGRLGYTATLLPDSTVLVAGGSRSGGGVASAELYDPSSGSWTAIGDMIEARAGPTALLLPDGTVLVAGGTRDGGDGSELASAELYDPGSGSWAATGEMIEARGGPTATLLPDGRVLVAGGFITNEGFAFPLASAELFDPSTGSWTATGNMIEARSSHAATLLPDGTVLVVGGDSVGGGGGELASAELYDPGTGSWTPTCSMAEVRSGPTATLLPDGMVLAAGGFSGGSMLASAELYDPSSGSWTATANMVGVRYAHTATLLLDGTVLVAGGNGINIPLASAELYGPGGT
jgi:hypothetical protein